MWKILVAFIVFAAVALALVFNMGDKIDMQGEAGHESEAHSEAAPAAPGAAPAAAPAAEAEKK
jgi:flagellar basal body-associated protein FliL